VSFNSFVSSAARSLHNAKYVAAQGLHVLRKDIAVTVYAVFVFLLLLLIIPLINTILLAVANGFADQPIFSSEHHLVKIIFVAIAVFASAACAAMLLSYFACAVAASTIAQLDGHPAPLLKGLKVFKNRFRHISRFALVSIGFIPIGFIVQRRKLAKGTAFNKAEVIGSSLSLSTAQLAPAILSEDKGIYDTVQHSYDTLGKSWREGLVIKIATYATVIFLTLLIGTLPSLVQSYWFDSSTSQEISRLMTILLVICLLLTAKVLGTVFNATLYWRVSSEGERKKLIE
jgi:hypothetical protein